MESFVAIGAAAAALGVSMTPLRRWEAEGRLAAAHTPGGHRRDDGTTLRPERCRAEENARRKTVAYARVASHDHKDDLERHQQVLARYCATQGWTLALVAALGAGRNSPPKGLRRVLSAVLAGDMGRLVIPQQDRLRRFGAELVWAMCEAQQVEVVLLNQGEETTCAAEVATDVLERIPVFSARLSGSRRRKNPPRLEGVPKAVEEAQGGSRTPSRLIPRTRKRPRVPVRPAAPAAPSTGHGPHGSGRRRRRKPRRRCRDHPQRRGGGQ